MNIVPGATPINLIDPNLIPSIGTEKERNEWERLNILRARGWALNPRVLSRRDPTDEIYLRVLHQRMFDKTWRWTGKYRSRDGINIGCRFTEIVSVLQTQMRHSDVSTRLRLYTRANSTESPRCDERSRASMVRTEQSVRNGVGNCFKSKWM